jgi:RNA polymerase sigma-70 factor, ECF subfamily
MLVQAVMKKNEEPLNSLTGDSVGERQLLHAALSGEFSAFDALVERHWRKVASVARHFLDADEVEDVVQETFVKAFERLRDFRGEAGFQTWLIRIAINLCKNRRQSWWRRHVVPFSDDMSPAAIGGQAPGPDTLFQGEWSLAVRKAVEQLPEKYRLPIILHYFEGLKGVEVAAVMECKESAVWARIYTGCRELRKQLAAWAE